VFLGVCFSRKNFGSVAGRISTTHPPSLTTFLIRVESLAGRTRHFIQPKKRTQPFIAPQNTQIFQRPSTEGQASGIEQSFSSRRIIHRGCWDANLFHAKMKGTRRLLERSASRVT
jgi:hypothetical protein